MKINYDLHIHSALSACALGEMTPNNIVNMSLLCELDVIAVTDHNAGGNVASVMKVADETPLVVIPGMEVETLEEIHMVCLFETVEEVINLQDEIFKRLPNRKNNTKVFGEQILFDHEDEEVGRIDQLLSFSAGISIDVLTEYVRSHGGVCIPAHIDRPSYSIISNLGMLPEGLSYPVLELSRYCLMADYKKKYGDHLLIQNSDAHELGHIGVCNGELEVEERTVHGVLERLKRI